MINIQINELRVGNYAGIASSLDFKIGTVTTISKKRLLLEIENIVYSSSNCKIVPLEITSDRLIDLGFKKQKALNFIPCYVIKSKKEGIFFTIYEHEVGVYTVHANNFDIKCNYIHQIQNIFFFSTGGEELVFSSIA